MWGAASTFIEGQHFVVVDTPLPEIGQLGSCGKTPDWESVMWFLWPPVRAWGSVFPSLDLSFLISE